MIIYSAPKAATSIPVVDLSGSFSGDLADRVRVASDIHRACRGTGFFYIVNHRVPQRLIDDQFAWSKRLFDLPSPTKLDMHIKKSPATFGYVPPGGQVLDSQDPNAELAPPDLNESFYCGMELPDDHPYVVRRVRSFGLNQWPAPLPGFRDQMLAWQGELRQLGDRLLALLALSLELPEDWFRPYYDVPTISLRLLRYPPHPDAARANQLGAGAHTDWGGITLLMQDDAGGLEVRNANGDWIEAPPIPGTFVINLGDLMARWTNGVYNSNMHRVKNNKSKSDRYSIPFFYSPGPDAIIEPIPTCVSADNPRRFETCTSAQHIAEMFRWSHGYAPEAATA